MMPFSNIKAIAFDLDGTLTNSAPGLTEAIRRALHALGLVQPEMANIVTWIGNGADVMIERALRWALGRAPAPDEQNDARQLFDTYYAKTVETGSTLYPQVAETLAALAAQQLPMTIVTNKPTPFIAPLLALLGIAQYFPLIIGGNDVVKKKPHPAPLFLVMGKWGLLPSELLFVGDSRNDILAARAAGCPCVGMTYGYNYGESIANSKPDLVLDHFRDLLPATGRSFSGYQA